MYRVCLLFITLLLLVACSDERVLTHTIFLDVQAKDLKVANKVSKLILDDMGRFECVMPRDWNIKYSTEPCVKVTKYIKNASLSQKHLQKEPNELLTIEILGGKKFRLHRQRISEANYVTTYKSNILTLSKNVEPTALNFAKKIITNPWFMIGYKE